jgi:benzodiazapine receptor
VVYNVDMPETASRHDSPIFELAVFICATLAVGIIGAVVTAPNIPTWYAAILKPAWIPPPRVFPIVWNVLYVCIGTAGFLVWRKRKTDPRATVALVWFVAQLLLNAGWSIVFFGLMNPAAALLEIVALWFAIVVTGLKFRPIDGRAALLFAPYLAWVSFAVFLNFTIWRLNA